MKNEKAKSTSQKPRGGGPKNDEPKSRAFVRLAPGGVVAGYKHVINPRHDVTASVQLGRRGVTGGKIGYTYHW